jgi:hypothetical protein
MDRGNGASEARVEVIDSSQDRSMLVLEAFLAIVAILSAFALAGPR